MKLMVLLVQQLVYRKATHTVLDALHMKLMVLLVQQLVYRKATHTVLV